MFDSAVVINAFQVELLQTIARDLDGGAILNRCAGHNHPPAWILGHLAITGEVGQQFLGGQVAHPEWIPVFGPGSSDDPADLSKAVPSLSLSSLVDAVDAAYQGLRDLATKHNDAPISDQPHGLDIFNGTGIVTVGHLVTLLLTNHFGFHLAQLSSCRRAAGYPALF